MVMTGIGIRIMIRIWWMDKDDTLMMGPRGDRV